MADVNSTFKVYISTDPVFKVYVNNGAKGDSGIDGIDGQNGEGVASGGFTGQFLIKLSEEDFDTGWSNIDSTQVSYGDGTVSEGLDNRYTKGETDLLLDDKSDVGHTHDDRYFTETEVGVLLSGKSDTSHTHDGRYYTETETDALLSGKSDTTHNHDLTYATLVHNHDDIYYTDDEVDTLLLSKSDTTHTHDLIKNATEANAKIEASSTGAVITRNVNDANIALKVNQQQGTGKILDLQFGGVSKVSADKDGLVYCERVRLASIANKTNALYSIVYTDDTGVTAYRNVADANPALKVNQANASSTGLITSFQFGGVEKASIDKSGTIFGNSLWTSYVSNQSSSLNARVSMDNTGTQIIRNVADANVALKVNQQNASSTGNIAEFQFNGTTKLAIDKNGLLPATNVTNTPSGNISATTVQGAINELDTEKADKLYATNLVTNGDFSNGTTGWTIIGSSITVDTTQFSTSPNSVLINQNGSNVRITKNIDTPVGSKFYTLLKCRKTSGTGGFAGIYDTQAIPQLISEIMTINAYDGQAIGTWVIYSSVFSSTTNQSTVSIGRIGSAVYVANFDDVFVINLTQTFGAGNEPTKAQMDNMLSTFTNSWFNGTAELVSIANLAQLKADKTQEAWITATLLNGATGELKYRKTTTELLEIYGSITVGTGTSGTSIAQLPTGYRPIPTYNPFRSLNNSTGGIVDLRISSSGVIAYATGMVTGHLIYFSVVLPL